MKWEYHVCEIKFDPSGESAATLDRLGHEGWELVTITTEVDKYGVASRRAILKRPKREPLARQWWSAHLLGRQILTLA